MVEGANFLVSFNNEALKHGFFTTRFVEAESPEEAENQAIELLRLELATLVENDTLDSPVMFVDETEEIDSFDGVNMPGAGFVWFPDEKGH
jgi:hypothetical protein